MQEWPVVVVFLCLREPNSHLDARVSAFARMTAGMTGWARLVQQARPSIENTIENVLIAVTSERWYNGFTHLSWSIAVAGGIYVKNGGCLKPT